MKPYRYIGPHDELNVSGLGLVKAGEPIDVPPELHDEFNARDDFEPVADRAKTAKKG